MTKDKTPHLEAPRVLSMARLAAGDYKVAADKSAITLWDLRRRTSPFSKKYVPGCNPRLRRTEKARGRWLFQVTCSKPDSAPKGWTVRLKVLRGKGRKLVTRDVLVSCSCPAWAYWGADYNAFHNGYSEAVRARIDRDQGIRDPGRTYLICKHVYTVGFLVREWAVPYEFEGEKTQRRRVRPEPEDKMYEVREVEPGVPEVVRRDVEPEEAPQDPRDKSDVREPQETPIREPRKTPTREPQEVSEEPTGVTVEDEDEEEDFPVYLL